MSTILPLHSVNVLRVLPHSLSFRVVRFERRRDVSLAHIANHEIERDHRLVDIERSWIGSGVDFNDFISQSAANYHLALSVRLNAVARLRHFVPSH